MARPVTNASTTSALSDAPTYASTTSALSDAPICASTTSDDDSASKKYDLVLDGYVSIVMVIEAAANCLYLRDRSNPAANLHLEMYCTWFFNRLKDSSEINEEDKKDIVKKLVGIRNALSHAHAEYCFLPRDPFTFVPMFILYEQINPKGRQYAHLNPDEAHYREVHRYTISQFANLCATLREVFLSWDLIDPKQEPTIGAREVQMAVMAR